MADKALFTVGVFGLAAKLVNDEVRIKVNVRTDQERQWQSAKLEPISGVQIVDCPGGGVLFGESWFEALEREIMEETGGCRISSQGSFSEPFVFASSDPVKPSDIAFWIPIVLLGEPKPSDEALDHPWISRVEFEAEKPYRCVSGLGNKGRTGRMIRAAFDFYENRKSDFDLFFFS